jgi:hypothetical protein
MRSLATCLCHVYSVIMLVWQVVFCDETVHHHALLIRTLQRPEVRVSVIEAGENIVFR